MVILKVQGNWARTLLGVNIELSVWRILVLHRCIHCHPRICSRLFCRKINPVLLWLRDYLSATFLFDFSISQVNNKFLIQIACDSSWGSYSTYLLLLGLFPCYIGTAGWVFLALMLLALGGLRFSVETPQLLVHLSICHGDISCLLWNLHFTEWNIHKKWDEWKHVYVHII